LISAHSLIPKVSAHVGFNNKALRDNFDKQLLMFKKSKSYSNIIDKYIGVGTVKAF